ncbi:MAG: SIMPL domain-containing protein [Thermomicrobiales bacterium]|nr:SIMPL domain-containing protein [Thermomicrobiales bacterium]
MKTRFTGTIGLMAAMLLLATPMVSAQTAEPTNGTITVSATGVVTAPAESAMIVITLGADTSMMPMPVEDSIETIDATAIPSMDDVIDPTPVVETLVAAGVPIENIEVVEQPFSGEWGGMWGPMPVSLIVTIDQPDVAHLSDLLRLTRETAHANGWFVNQFGVLYQVSDCRPLLQEARVNAMTNATNSAEDQAAAMNLTLGSPVGSRDNSLYGVMGMPMPSCSDEPTMYQTSRVYMASMFDPTLPAEVTVSVTIDVTFAAE